MQDGVPNNRNKCRRQMRRFIVCCCLACLPPLAGVAGAQVPDKPDAVPAHRAGGSLSDVEMRDVRDPFWPVGFYPDWWQRSDEPEDPALVEAAHRAEWEAAYSQLRIGGISRMGRAGYVAYVNGRMVQQGDVVSIEHNNQTYRWRIIELGADGIRFSRIEP